MPVKMSGPKTKIGHGCLACGKFCTGNACAILIIVMRGVIPEIGKIQYKVGTTCVQDKVTGTTVSPSLDNDKVADTAKWNDETGRICSSITNIYFDPCSAQAIPTIHAGGLQMKCRYNK